MRRAYSYLNKKPHELLLEVVRLSSEMNEKVADLRKTQKTIGILLHKLGQTAANNHSTVSDGSVGPGGRLSTGLNFSGGFFHHDSDDDLDQMMVRREKFCDAMRQLSGFFSDLFI